MSPEKYTGHGFGDWCYAHIAANATTVLKTGPGVFGCFVLNTNGRTGNTATVYDGVDATGAVIAVIDTTALALGDLAFSVDFTVGLTVVTATGTPGDVTILYR